jgi:hypothetical protein
MSNKIAESEPVEEPTRPIEYDEVIKRVTMGMDSGMVATMNETACFGWMWRETSNPDEPSCPVAAECDLAEACETVWELVQQRLEETKGRRPQAEILPTTTDPIEPLPDQESKPKKRRRKVKRHKWVDAGKYDRVGYQDAERPVDKAVVRLTEVLGNPPVLPSNWNPVHFNEKYATMGSFLCSKTASYHSFLLNGVTILRFWTNAANCALVDFVPDLLSEVRKLPNLKVQEVLAGSRKKLRPCTHRVLIPANNLGAVEAIGLIVKNHWKL